MIAVTAMAVVVVVSAVHVVTGVRAMAGVRAMVVLGVVAMVAHRCPVVAMSPRAIVPVVTSVDIDVAMTGIAVVNGAGIRGPEPFIVSAHTVTVYPLGV